jgi:four helix bundle protein
LTAQLRRSVVSASSNIAEGHARQAGEFPHFLSIARGSLAECESQIELAILLQFITPHHAKAALSLANEISRTRTPLQSKVRSARAQRPPPHPSPPRPS